MQNAIPNTAEVQWVFRGSLVTIYTDLATICNHFTLVREPRESHQCLKLQEEHAYSLSQLNLIQNTEVNAATPGGKI